MPATLTCCNCGHELTRPDIKPLESPFPDLLKLDSNAVLPSSQTNVIASSISSALWDVLQLDQDILRLKNTIVELCRKRDERRSFAIAHKALVSPMRRVPPEIITEVFLYSVEGNLGCPISLASICSRWRLIALSSPQLWASFEMIVNPENLESQIALAKMWLLRAGKHPLSIELIADEEDILTDASLADVHSLVEVFVARSTSSTQKLAFGPTDWNLTCQDISAVFSTAPKLRFLHIADLSWDTRLQLPWRQLHELVLDGTLSAHNFLDILETTPSLQKCEFWIGITQTENTHAPSSITLPMLRSMTIWFYGKPQDLLYFFSAIHLPVIQELAITNVRHHGRTITTPLNFPSAFANTIVAMISHGSLLKLTLDLKLTTQITPASAVSILRAAPKLMELSLREGAALVLSREFADQFNASNACLVPNLKKLELVSFAGQDVPLALDMIEGRCLANDRYPLDQLVLRWHVKNPLDSALQTQMVRMTQMGLDIQLFLNDVATPCKLPLA